MKKQAENISVLISIIALVWIFISFIDVNICNDIEATRDLWEYNFFKLVFSNLFHWI